MNIFKRIIRKIFDILIEDVSWDEVRTLNPDHVTAEKISKMLNISEKFANVILRTSVRRREAVPCCSHYDSVRHKNCYRFITGGNT